MKKKVFANGRFYTRPEVERLLEKAQKANIGFQVQQAEAILKLFSINYEIPEEIIRINF